MAVKVFKQRTVKDTSLTKGNVDSSTSLSQSLKDLSTRPKPGISPEPIRVHRKSGSPVIQQNQTRTSPRLLTTRSLETLNRPESPSLPALEPGSGTLKSNALNSSSHTSASSSSTPSPGSFMQLAGLSTLGSNLIYSPNLAAKQVPAFVVPTMQTSSGPQYSIPPLLFLNNMLTVAKIDELRRSSLTLPPSNGPYPVKTPSLGTAVVGSNSLLTNSGTFGAAATGIPQQQHQSGLQSYAQAVVSDLSPKKDDTDFRKPSFQLPPLNNKFCCKQCFFVTTHQTQLDEHISTCHGSPSSSEGRDQFLKPSMDVSQQELMGQSFKDERSPTFLNDEHNSTASETSNSLSENAPENNTSMPGLMGSQGTKPYKCSRCSYSTMYENCLKSHEARHSSDFDDILNSTNLNAMKVNDGFKCTICNNYTTSYKRCLASHLLKHKIGPSPSFKSYRPRISSSKSSNSKSPNHSITAHGEGNVRPTSGSSFNFSDDEQCSSLMEATNQDLVIDEENEENPIGYEDEEDNDEPCSKRQNTRSSHDYMEVDEHFQAASTPDLKKNCNACPFCETIFKSYEMLEYHLSFHGDKDPFKCSFCGVECKNSLQFEQHLIREPHS